MNQHLDAVVRSHKDAHHDGRPAGITSVCSAHPLVIEAALRQAVSDRSPVLVEATKQVYSAVPLRELRKVRRRIVSVPAGVTPRTGSIFFVANGGVGQLYVQR